MHAITHYAGTYALDAAEVLLFIFHCAVGLQGSEKTLQVEKHAHLAGVDRAVAIGVQALEKGVDVVLRHVKAQLTQATPELAPIHAEY